MQKMQKPTVNNVMQHVRVVSFIVKLVNLLFLTSQSKERHPYSYRISIRISDSKARCAKVRQKRIKITFFVVRTSRFNDGASTFLSKMVRDGPFFITPKQANHGLPVIHSPTNYLVTRSIFSRSLKSFCWATFSRFGATSGQI